MRVTWNVPVYGATTVIAKDPADLKKISLVERTMPTTGSSVGAKGARAITSHGGGGWLGEGEGGGGLGGEVGNGEGGNGLGDDGDGGGGLGNCGDGDRGGGLGLGGGGLGLGGCGDGDGG